MTLARHLIIGYYTECLDIFNCKSIKSCHPVNSHIYNVPFFKSEATDPSQCNA